MRSSRPRLDFRLLLGLAMALVLALGVAACGGSDDDDGGGAGDGGADVADTPEGGNGGDGEGNGGGGGEGNGGDGSDGGTGGAGDDAEAGSERARARATVERLYDAMADMDAEGVCAQLNERAQREIAEGARRGEGGTCVEGFEGFFEAAREAGGLDATLNADIRRVEVDGDRAVATVSFGRDGQGEVPLTKVDGEWKLEASGASAAP